MSTTHTVLQGEHLPAIAARYGFLDYRHIWDDAANSQLKELRKSPNVLAPGDELTIPDLEPKNMSRPSGALHRFRIKVPPVWLRLIVLDASGEPVADAEGELRVDGARQTVKTDGQGKLQVAIPATASEGQLTIKNDDVDLDIHIGIGELDPVDLVTGQIARLNNLGYDAGLVQEPADEEALSRFQSAVEEFQCDEGLKADGECGSQTQAKLEEVHGC